MREKRSLSPVEELRKEKLEKLERCFSELESYKQNKLRLQHPTFFVPGWTSEDCAAWKEPYKKIPPKYKRYYRPAKQWIDKITVNKEKAHFVEFTNDETKNSPSFLELGKYLKRKIIQVAGSQPVNLIGHSMGGLDIRSAIIDDDEPILNIKNVITVGTPNNGTVESALLGNKCIQKIIKKFKNFEPWHLTQGYNLYCNSGPIKTINVIENRLKLLNRLEKFYVLMGLKDSTVKSSPKLKKEGIKQQEYDEKVKILQTSSAEHSGENGITQDPRVFLPVFKILCGIELIDSFNHGYIYMKGD